MIVFFRILKVAVNSRAYFMFQGFIVKVCAGDYLLFMLHCVWNVHLLKSTFATEM